MSNGERPYPPAPLPVGFPSNSPQAILNEVNPVINALLTMLGPNPAGSDASLTARLATIQAEDAYHAGDGVEKLAILLARSGLITYSQGVHALDLAGLSLGSPAIRRSHDVICNPLNLAALALGTPRSIPNMRPNGLDLAALALGTPRPIPGMKPNGLSLAGLSLGSPAVAALLTNVFMDGNTTTSPQTVDVGASHYTDLSVSMWLRVQGTASDIGLNVVNGIDTDPSPGGSTVYVAIFNDPTYGLCIHYQETSDNLNIWDKDWIYALPTDGEWHHIGISAGACKIDGVTQTPVVTLDTEQPGSVHPTFTGANTGLLLSSMLGTSGLHVADLRIWKMVSDYGAQKLYNSTLLNNVSGEIIGAWLMNEGSGTDLADRSVEANDLTVPTGWSWSTG